MNFLEVIKKNYEENEHLHLLVKFDYFVMGIHMDDQFYMLKFQANKCFIMEQYNEGKIPTIYLNKESKADICTGVLLGRLIESNKVSYKGSLREKLLMESLLFLGTGNYLNHSEAVV